MLQVPTQRGTEKYRSLTENPAPCYRCLFEKPVNEGQCDPATCEMLDAWLLDKDFSWSKYETKWLKRLEQENIDRLRMFEQE